MSNTIEISDIEPELRAILAAPAVERQEPVAADIAHDRAYRNGIMAGFQFGISGNEKGYAVAIANFNSEINAAKGELPAPIAVPHTMKSVMSAICAINGFPMLTSNQCHLLALALNKVCLDKVKGMNQ